MPLIRPETLRRLRAAVAAGADIAVLAFRAADPTGLPRLIVSDHGTLTAIRAERDTTPAERSSSLCTGDAMAFAGNKALAILEKIGNDNARAEFYLTDCVAVAIAIGLVAVALEIEEEEAQSLNSAFKQLAKAEAMLQRYDSLPASSGHVIEQSKKRTSARNHLVVLVHGINTRAQWMTEIKPALERVGFSVAATSYGKNWHTAFSLALAQTAPESN